MSDHRTTTAAVHVGQPSPLFPEWARTILYFHGFVGLSTNLTSSRFTYVGHQWGVQLFPRGHVSAREGMVSVALDKFQTSASTLYMISVSEYLRMNS